MEMFVRSFFEELAKLAEAQDPERWNPAWVYPSKGTEQFEANELPPPKRRDLKRHLKSLKKRSSS